MPVVSARSELALVKTRVVLANLEVITNLPHCLASILYRHPHCVDRNKMSTIDSQTCISVGQKSLWTCKNTEYNNNGSRVMNV